MNTQNKFQLNKLLQIVVLASLYFASGELSLLFLHGNQIVTTGIFVAEGISLAFILFFGKAVWPGVFLGQIVLALTNDISLSSALLISAINSFQAILAYILFQRLKLHIELQTFRDIGALVGIIFIVQFIGATLSNTVLMLDNTIASSEFISSSFSWWFGNVMGQLLITPALLLLFSQYKQINAFDLIISTTLFALLVYFLEVSLFITNILLILSLTVPFIVFITAYKSFIFGAIFSVILALVTSYSVYIGIGAFHTSDISNNVINYNLFILAHISAVYLIGTLFEERKRNFKILEQTIEEEISKNKKQQLLLLQQSRLAQMGEMIAMIAHQWRQPLNNLSLVNQLLISKYQKGKLNDETIEHFKENSKKQIIQMSTTIDDFRDFFKTEQWKQEFCVNEVVENILSITQNIYLTYGISVNFIHSQKRFTHGYKNALGQAILNIINNSKDAFLTQKTEDKLISISLEQKETKLLLLIKDNAGGIDTKIADKVFDPYFSTKESKNGTGLGLYMTKMIINEKLNGEVHFYNNDANGVTFEISLEEITDVA